MDALGTTLVVLATLAVVAIAVIAVELSETLRSFEDSE